jgi:hypothetical protein
MIITAKIIIFSSIILGSVIQRREIEDYRQLVCNKNILVEHSYALPCQCEQGDVLADSECSSNSEFSTEAVKFDSEEFDVGQSSFKTEPIDSFNAQGMKNEVLYFDSGEAFNVDETDGDDVEMLLNDSLLFENCLEEFNLKQDDLFEILEKGEIEFSDTEE